ncbi:MAG TPA: zf-HC2 domain-containing protein [Blastocatellia bacterium]|nr:zf-HC2 domain-containing protein [Blastocatellia bacterium]
MKCDDCIAIIEEYLDGELGKRETEQVRLHLGACSDCAGIYGALEQEQKIYARYQRDIDVGPAMWAAVQARIKEDAPARAASRKGLRELLAGLFATPRLSFAYAVALVLIAVGATVAVMSYMQSGAPNNSGELASRDKETAPSPPPGKDGGGGEVEKKPESIAPSVETEKAPVVAENRKPRRKVVRPPSPEQLVREAEEKYLSAIAILTRDVNRRRSKLDPVVLARFDTALASIDRTIEETRAAARQNPDDPVALQYMLAAYSKKVDLLREMARN